MNTSSSRDMWSEQRVYPRAPVDLQIQLQHPAGPQLARLRDLSLGGMATIVEDPPPLGTLVNVALELEDLGRIDALAVIVRTGDVVGLRFSGLSAEEFFALQTYLSRKPART